MSAQNIEHLPMRPDEKRFVGAGNEFLTAFRRSQQSSIDAFLSNRAEFMDIGRHAIVAALLPLEAPRVLLEDDPKDHWYRYLLDAMNAPWAELADNRVSFITFNYDRSLELFLEDAISHRYGKTVNEARALVSLIPIVHVYGQMGSLDPAAANHVPYGGASHAGGHYLLRAAAGIQVVPEGRDDSPTFEQARKLLSKADALCLLGFGFDEINVRRLGGVDIQAGARVGAGGTTSTAFAATAYGMKDAERLRAARQISHANGLPSVHSGMYELMCLDMLRKTGILHG